MRSVLTGFKWIGDQIANLEAAGEVDRFIFGFEESYGYLAGPYVRAVSYTHLDVYKRQAVRSWSRSSMAMSAEK